MAVSASQGVCARSRMGLARRHVNRDSGTLTNMKIQSHSTLSLNEVIPAMRNHFRYHPVFRVLKPAGLLMMGGFLFSITQGTNAILTMLPFGLLGLVLIFGVRWMTVLAFRIQFRRLPLKNSEIHWTFTEEGMSAEGDGFQQSLAWCKFHRLIDTPDGFLLYPQSMIFMRVPFRGFSDETEIGLVRVAARDKVRNYKKVV